MMTLGAIVAGFILDLIFGDPHWLPHPICLIGNLIGFLDKNCGVCLLPAGQHYCSACLDGNNRSGSCLCRAVCCADVGGTC